MSKKKTSHVRNWGNYNKALIKRGSLTLWFDEEALNRWYERRKTGKRGHPCKYADIAILCGLTLKAVFHLPLRATQGLVMSIIDLLKLPIDAADYTTLCRRQKNIKVPLQRYNRTENFHGVFDSTGLKVFGEGEWKVRQHGYSKHRTWRKLHIGIDEKTGEIVARVLTTNDISDGEILPNLVAQIEESLSQASGDGAYDNFENYNLLSSRGIKITIPPRDNAKIRRHGNCNGPPLARDEIIRKIRTLGRAEWKKQSEYHRRSIAETTMFRYKKIFGDELSARLFDNQTTEVFIKCNILNKMTSLCMQGCVTTC